MVDKSRHHLTRHKSTCIVHIISTHKSVSIGLIQHVHKAMDMDKLSLAIKWPASTVSVWERKKPNWWRAKSVFAIPPVFPSLLDEGSDWLLKDTLFFYQFTGPQWAPEQPLLMREQWYWVGTIPLDIRWSRSLWSSSSSPAEVCPA